MTDNVIEFNKPNKPTIGADHILTLTMYADEDGMYEVEMDINDGYADFEIYAAMEAASAKFAVDHDLVEMALYSEQEPANDQG